MKHPLIGVLYITSSRLIPLGRLAYLLPMFESHPRMQASYRLSVVVYEPPQYKLRTSCALEAGSVEQSSGGLGTPSEQVEPQMSKLTSEALVPLDEVLKVSKGLSVGLAVSPALVISNALGDLLMHEHSESGISAPEQRRLLLQHCTVLQPGSA